MATDTTFVCMTDTFLSGWGKASEGTSYFCVECDTIYQVDAVEAAAHDREEMTRVRIASNPTRGKPGDHVSVKHFDSLGDVWKRHYRPAAD